MMVKPGIAVTRVERDQDSFKIICTLNLVDFSVGRIYYFSQTEKDEDDDDCGDEDPYWVAEVTIYKELARNEKYFAKTMLTAPSLDYHAGMEMAKILLLQELKTLGVENVQYI